MPSLVPPISASYFHRQWGTALVGQHRPFGARFTPIHRGRTRRVAAQRRFGDHPIEGLPFPRNTHVRIIVDAAVCQDKYALFHPEPSGSVGCRGMAAIGNRCRWRTGARRAGWFVRPQNRGDAHNVRANRSWWPWLSSSWLRANDRESAPRPQQAIFGIGSRVEGARIGMIAPRAGRVV